MYVTKKRSEVIWFAAPTAIIFLLLMIRFPIFTKEEKGDKYVNAMLTIFPNIEMINIDIIEKNKINAENAVEVSNINKLEEFVKLNTKISPKKEITKQTETVVTNNMEVINEYELYWPVLSSKIDKKDIDKGVTIQTKLGMAASSSINGKVLSIEMEYNKKHSVTLERKDGLKVKYALLTAVNIKKDSIVAEGDKIGETGEFMRFEVIVNNLSVDPMLFSYR